MDQKTTDIYSGENADLFKRIEQDRAERDKQNIEYKKQEITLKKQIYADFFTKHKDLLHTQFYTNVKADIRAKKLYPTKPTNDTSDIQRQIIKTFNDELEIEIWKVYHPREDY